MSYGRRYGVTEQGEGMHKNRYTGSISPMLFNLYINDVEKHLPYADVDDVSVRARCGLLDPESQPCIEETTNTNGAGQKKGRCIPRGGKIRYRGAYTDEVLRSRSTRTGESEKTIVKAIIKETSISIEVHVESQCRMIILYNSE